jgi:hypothetical protein
MCYHHDFDIFVVFCFLQQNIEPRLEQPGIRYARFHDEHLMRGDIFDTST